MQLAFDRDKYVKGDQEQRLTVEMAAPSTTRTLVAKFNGNTSCKISLTAMTNDTFCLC